MLCTDFDRDFNCKSHCKLFLTYFEIFNGKMSPIFSNNVWQTYFFWVFWDSMAFVSIYPTCNWLTSQRMQTFNLYFDAELSIPFVPEFIWAYLSMNLLFLMPPFFLDVSGLKSLGKQLIAATFFSGSVFLFLPAKLGFERSISKEPIYQTLFSTLFLLDMPYNLVPSLHVVFSAIIAFAIINVSQSRGAKAIWRVWLSLICLSTLLVHQHHLLDLMTGLAVARWCHILSKKGEVYV